MTSKKDQLICRTCLKVITEDELCASAGTYTNFGKVIDILETCVSELNLDLSDDVVICCHCFTTLGIAYDFKLKCIKTEERIFAHMQRRNLPLINAKIHLADVIEDATDDDNFENETYKKENVTSLQRINGFIESYPSKSFPHVVLDVEDIIRRERMAKQVINSFDDEFYKNTNNNYNSKPKVNKLDEYAVVIFDNMQHQSTKSEEDLIVRSIAADCNMVLENCRLNSTKEDYFDELFDTISMSDDYVCANDLEKIL